MKIVVNIPDRLYKKIEDYSFDDLDATDTTMFVRNGILLPKGHGRLIDADELHGDFIDGTEGYDCQTWNRIEIGDIIDNAPTIIEADTGSEV